MTISHGKTKSSLGLFDLGRATKVPSSFIQNIFGVLFRASKKLRTEENKNAM